LPGYFHGHCPRVRSRAHAPGSMLICGSGSGIRDPLKTNSRGKLLVFRVVVAIFISPK
jgi:hypothetical protein